MKDNEIEIIWFSEWEPTGYKKGENGYGVD